MADAQSTSRVRLSYRSNYTFDALWPYNAWHQLKSSDDLRWCKDNWMGCHDVKLPKISLEGIWEALVLRDTLLRRPT